MAEKRIIEYEAASELANDDWLLIDGVTEGTRKARPSTVTAELGTQVTNLASTVGGLTQVAMGHEQSFAPDYDESASYDVGDLVMQYHGLYKCTAPTTGPWDAGKWARTEVSEQLEESGKIDDVQVNGVSVVTDKVANIDLTDMQEDIDSKVADVTIGGESILDNNKVANLDFLASYGEASGEIASFNDGAAMPLKSLKVGIEATQDLHGYDNPWVGGAGKNKLPMTVEGIKAVNTYHSWSGNSTTINNVNITIETDNVGNVIGIRFNGTASADITFNLASNITIPNGSYVWSNDQIVNISNLWLSLASPNIAITLSNEKEKNVTVSNGSIDSAYIYANSGNAFNNIVFKPMIRLASVSDSTFAPYSNICPISGWSAVNVAVSPTTDAEDGTTYTTALKDGQGNPLECYGGTLDVVSGELVVDRISKMFDGSEDWQPNGNKGVFIRTSNIPNIETSKTFITDTYKTVPRGEAPSDGCINYNSAGNAIQIHDERAMAVEAYKTLLQANPIQLVYYLATPITIQLTPTAVKSLLGTNNLWADSGDILECKYVRDNSAVINDLIARVTALENA